MSEPQIVQLMGQPDRIDSKADTAFWEDATLPQAVATDVRRQYWYTVSTFFLPISWTVGFDEKGAEVSKHSWDSTAAAAGGITTHWNGPAGRNGPCDSKDGRAPGRPFNADPLCNPKPPTLPSPPTMLASTFSEVGETTLLLTGGRSKASTRLVADSADGSTFLEVYINHLSGVDFRFHDVEVGYNRWWASMEQHLIGFSPPRPKPQRPGTRSSTRLRFGNATKRYNRSSCGRRSLILVIRLRRNVSRWKRRIRRRLPHARRFLDGHRGK